jgi:hypothetical protein
MRSFAFTSMFSSAYHPAHVIEQIYFRNLEFKYSDF